MLKKHTQGLHGTSGRVGGLLSGRVGDVLSGHSI